MRIYLMIFKSELFFATRNLVRYPLNSLISIILLTLVFVSLYYSAKSMAIVGGAKSDAIVYSLAVFMAWSITITSLSSIAADIEEYARRGVLEQLVVSGHRYEVVAVIKSMVTVLIATINNAFILIILSLFLGETLPISFQLIAWISLVLLSAMGVGMIIGAIAILTKQSSAITNLVQFLLLPMFFLQLTLMGEVSFSWSWIVPTILPVKILLASISNNEYVVLLPSAIASSVCWFLIGYIAIYWAVGRAKKHGLLYQS